MTTAGGVITLITGAVALVLPEGPGLVCIGVGIGLSTALVVAGGIKGHRAVKDLADGAVHNL